MEKQQFFQYRKFCGSVLKKEVMKNRRLSLFRCELTSSRLFPGSRLQDAGRFGSPPYRSHILCSGPFLLTNMRGKKWIQCYYTAIQEQNYEKQEVETFGFV